MMMLGAILVSVFVGVIIGYAEGKRRGIELAHQILDSNKGDMK